jgi:AcrR family transcriptional regulator
MSRPAATLAQSPADTRRRALLDAAVAVFIRYGYRKTSMDEVARAAQLSRQGLYLHFATKEELFRAALTHALETALEGARQGVRAGATLETKLVRAFDEWVGRYVGMMGTGANDLLEAASALVGPLVEEYEERFADLVVKTLMASRLPAAYRRVGLTPRELEATLAATARGLKHGSETREAFVRGMTIAVRALCAPLADGR